MGGPALLQFAPYAAHVLTVDFFFYLALKANLISPARPSNRIDIAYVYYLPFCMVFVSNDRLHERVVPLFLADDQDFVLGEEFKAELTRLDAYYSKLPEDVRERGIMSFASYPPLEGDFLTARLWDRFLPKWRAHAEKPVHRTKEADAKLLEHLKNWDEAAKVRGAEEVSDLNQADAVIIERRVPVRMGKWRILPPEVEMSKKE